MRSVFVLTILTVVLCTYGFSVNLKNFGKFLDKKYNLGFLKDVFKIPIYIDPHPLCALENEECTEDSNCCGGRECKMAVDHEGVKYTCQEWVGGDRTETEGSEWEREWEREDNSNSLMREVYKARLKDLKQEEQRLINDQYYMIKELQKPLSFDEMRELQQIKEMEDYKRENELRELRKWRERKIAEESEKKEKEQKLKDLAAERVSKVLKEEEKEKQAIFKEMQEKKPWF